MNHQFQFVAGMPHLDVSSLMEDWAVAAGFESHWKLLAQSLSLTPSKWFDTQGDRMYAAAVYLRTKISLDAPVQEDDVVDVETTFQATRKPHALSKTCFKVDGETRFEVELLSSFIKRSESGSNKKFVRVRGVWTEEDFNGAMIDDLLDRHHHAKATPDKGDVVNTYTVNRMVDFNTADFMYFKNYVRLARAAEWCVLRNQAPLLNATRECFFYGNVNDAETIESRVAIDGSKMQTSHHAQDGKRIFLSNASVAPVNIQQR